MKIRWLGIVTLSVVGLALGWIATEPNPNPRPFPAPNWGAVAPSEQPLCADEAPQEHEQALAR